jgi:hypothetical protein
MKLTLKPPRPRNPLALPARQRSAGAHRPSPGARRQHARRALRDDVTAYSRGE